MIIIVFVVYSSDEVLGVYGTVAIIVNMDYPRRRSNSNNGSHRAGSTPQNYSKMKIHVMRI